MAAVHKRLRDIQKVIEEVIGDTPYTTEINGRGHYLVRVFGKERSVSVTCAYSPRRKGDYSKFRRYLQQRIKEII